MCRGKDIVNGTPASCTCDLQCGEIGTGCSDVVITCPDGELERERESERVRERERERERSGRKRAEKGKGEKTREKQTISIELKFAFRASFKALQLPQGHSLA